LWYLNTPDTGGDLWERLVCYGFKGVLLGANVFTGLAGAFAEDRGPRENVL
jgi:hypothetical protein